MNHKLHNTILASAVVGVALLSALLVAEPIGSGAGPAGGHYEASIHTTGSMIAGDFSNDLARDMERHTRRLGSDLTAVGSAGEALTVASALFATSVVEATLATVLEDMAHRPPPVPRAHAATADARSGRAIRSRSAMAMPYFSTARSTYRDHGE